MNKGIRGIIFILVGLLGVAGCGGGSSSSVSKAEYTQQLELVCNKGLQEREELIGKVSQEFQKHGRKPTEADQKENIRKLMAVYQGTTEEIADVGLPKQDEKKAEELVTAREDAVAKVEADPLSAISEFAKIFAKPNKIGEELEVGSCAK